MPQIEANQGEDSAVVGGMQNRTHSPYKVSWGLFFGGWVKRVKQHLFFGAKQYYGNRPDVFNLPSFRPSFNKTCFWIQVILVPLDTAHNQLFKFL